MVEIAWAVMALWPVAAIVFFRTLSPPAALIATMLGGYLLLPDNLRFNLPVLPTLHKDSIPVYMALLLTVFVVSQRQHTTADIAEGWIPRSRIFQILIAMLVVGAFGTALTNRDTLVYGPIVLSSLTLYDGFSILLQDILIFVPLLLGRKLLFSHSAQVMLLKAFAIAAIVYSIPALWEVRMSPQLNMQIYGYFPSSFFQQVRAGGFRPVVFLAHGLELAVFFTYAVLAAVILARIAQDKERLRWFVAFAWLLIVLVLCKSLGPLLIVMVLLPVAFLLKPRTQLLVASCIAGIVLTYPVLRSADLIPVDRLLNAVAAYDPARAASFNTRISNEVILLEKALDRPIFGWGTWGRPRVFNEFGRDISITDGSWVITLGRGGWVRYIAILGLLCLPVILLFLRHRDKLDLATTGLTLLLCVKLVDLIPNPTIQPFVWLFAGALIGRLEANNLLGAKGSVTPAPHNQQTRRELQYARNLSGSFEENPGRTQDFPSEKSQRRAQRYTRPDISRSHRS